jgi:hypothetical protein
MDTLLPAGPHLSNGCFQRRAWESSGAAGRALPWHYGQGAGMGQRNSRLTGYGWADRGENQHTHTLTAFRIPVKN